MKNNKTGNYIQLTNYPLEYFQPLFTDERWTEILKVVNNWIHPELKDGRIYKSILMNPETMKSFNVGEKEKVAGHMMEYMQKQVLEVYLSEEEVKMCNDKAMDAYCEARDKRIYDAATKIEEKDYGNPVFYGDNFYMSVDDLRDCWDYDDPLPEYVFGTTEHHTINSCDLEHMLYNLFENVGEINEEYPKIPKIPDYLQEAWDKFVDENSEKYYHYNNKTVVLLDKTLNHNAEYEATND
jgi:hypothetical protein